jgi:hypothetical protein
MDHVGVFIATLHQMLGHDKAAAFLGMPVEPGEQANCVLCLYERGRATKQEVQDAIGVSRGQAGS